MSTPTTYPHQLNLQKAHLVRQLLALNMILKLGLNLMMYDNNYIQIILEEVIHCRVDVCDCIGELSTFSCLRNESILIQSRVVATAFLLGNPFEPKRLIQSNIIAYNDSDMQSTMNLTSDLYIKWTLNTDNTSFDFAISWNQLSWIGFGLQNSMDNVDMWVFQAQGNQVYAVDSWAVGESSPLQDTQQDLKIISYQVTSTGYNIRFNRKLNTGDQQDQILTSGDNYTFSFAYSSDEIINEHTFVAGFDIFINGFSGQASLITSADILFTIHGIVFYICWAFIADFGIIIGRFCKSINSYIWIHAICFMIVDFCTIIIMILILVKGGVQSQGETLDYLLDPHSIIALVLLITVSVQHIFGIITKHIIEDITKNNREIVLLLKKAHAIFGTLIYLLAKVELIIGLIFNEYPLLLILGLIWIILLLFVRIGLEGWIAKSSKMQLKIKPKQRAQSTEDQIEVMKLLQADTPTNQIIEQFPNLIWCIYNEDVYDLTGFQHPGGNFLIKSIQGREVSRFIHGAYDLENTKSTKHLHSQMAIHLLQQRYIGSLASSEKDPSGTDSWTIIEKTQLSNNIMQFELSNKIPIQLKQSFSQFGKHYLISLSEFGSKQRMYTKVLSMSKPCVDYRIKLIQLYENPTQDPPKLVYIQSETLPLIIKKYNYHDALSKQLFETNQQVYLSGPYGRGLEIEDGQIVAFAGGTGLLPYLDLLDYLFHKSVFLALSQAAKTMHFEDSGPNFQIKLIATFQNESEFIGREWIRKLYQINKNHQLGLFDMMIRYSDGKMDEVIPKFEGRFTREFVNKHVGNSDDVQILICGPPSMNYSLLEILGSAKKLLII